MFKWIVSFLLISICLPSFAKDVYVFESRRALSLVDGQQLPKDYYINAGTESGLRKDVVVTVNRRTAFYDPYQNKSAGDIMVPVAELRIIYSQNGLSVARLEKMHDRAFLPSLEYEAVMVGDRLDLSSASKREKRAEMPSVRPIPVYGPRPESKEVIEEKAEFSSMAPAAPVIPQPDLNLNSQTL